MLRHLQRHVETLIHQAEMTDRRLNAARTAGDIPGFESIEKTAGDLFARAEFYDAAGAAEIDRGEKAALGFVIDRLNALYDALAVQPDGTVKYHPGAAVQIDEAGTALRLLTFDY